MSRREPLAGGASARAAGGGGGRGFPISDSTRASMSRSTFSASARRPFDSDHRGDSGTNFQARKAKMTGTPPRKNITRQPVVFASEGISTSASSGDRKYPTDRNV